jgi:hypothetical protein
MFIIFKIFVQGDWLDFHQADSPHTWKISKFDSDGYVVDVYSSSPEESTLQRKRYRTWFYNFIDKYNHIIINTLFY